MGKAVEPKSTPPEGFSRYIGVKIIHARLGLCPEGGMGKYKEGDPGYEVMYEDGYTSWSPQAVFYEAYRSTRNMSFGLATEAMKKGFRVVRRGWNGKGIFGAMQEVDSKSFMSAPCFYLDSTGLQTDNQEAPKNRVPWSPSQTDMLSDDWLIVEGAPAEVAVGLDDGCGEPCEAGSGQ